MSFVTASGGGLADDFAGRDHNLNSVPLALTEDRRAGAATAFLLTGWVATAIAAGAAALIFRASDQSSPVR